MTFDFVRAKGFRLAVGGLAVAVLAGTITLEQDDDGQRAVAFDA